MEAVLVAIIGGVFALAGVWLTGRRTRSRVAETRDIVKGNGHGNLTEMVTVILQRTEDQANLARGLVVRAENQEAVAATHARLLAQIGGSLADHAVSDAVAFEEFRELLHTRRSTDRKESRDTDASAAEHAGDPVAHRRRRPW